MRYREKKGFIIIFIGLSFVFLALVGGTISLFTGSSYADPENKAGILLEYPETAGEMAVGIYKDNQCVQIDNSELEFIDDESQIFCVKYKYKTTSQVSSTNSNASPSIDGDLEPVELTSNEVEKDKVTFNITLAPGLKIPGNNWFAASGDVEKVSYSYSYDTKKSIAVKTFDSDSATYPTQYTATITADVSSGVSNFEFHFDVSADEILNIIDPKIDNTENSITISSNNPQLADDGNQQYTKNFKVTNSFSKTIIYSGVNNSSLYAGNTHAGFFNRSLVGLYSGHGNKYRKILFKSVEVALSINNDKANLNNLETNIKNTGAYGSMANGGWICQKDANQNKVTCKLENYLYYAVGIDPKWLFQNGKDGDSFVVTVDSVKYCTYDASLNGENCETLNPQYKNTISFGEDVKIVYMNNWGCSPDEKQKYGFSSTDNFCTLTTEYNLDHPENVIRLGYFDFVNQSPVSSGENYTIGFKYDEKAKVTIVKVPAIDKKSLDAGECLYKTNKTGSSWKNCDGIKTVSSNLDKYFQISPSLDDDEWITELKYKVGVIPASFKLNAPNAYFVYYGTVDDETVNAYENKVPSEPSDYIHLDSEIYTCEDINCNEKKTNKIYQSYIDPRMQFFLYPNLENSVTSKSVDLSKDENGNLSFNYSIRTFYGTINYTTTSIYKPIIYIYSKSGIPITNLKLSNNLGINLIEGCNIDDKLIGTENDFKKICSCNNDQIKISASYVYEEGQNIGLVYKIDFSKYDGNDPLFWYNAKDPTNSSYLSLSYNIKLSRNSYIAENSIFKDRYDNMVYVTVADKNGSDGSTLQCVQNLSKNCYNLYSGFSTEYITKNDVTYYKLHDQNNREYQITAFEGFYVGLKVLNDNVINENEYEGKIFKNEPLKLRVLFSNSSTAKITKDVTAYIPIPKDTRCYKSSSSSNECITNSNFNMDFKTIDDDSLCNNDACEIYLGTLTGNDLNSNLDSIEWQKISKDSTIQNSNYNIIKIVLKASSDKPIEPGYGIASQQSNKYIDFSLISDDVSSSKHSNEIGAYYYSDVGSLSGYSNSNKVTVKQYGTVTENHYLYGTTTPVASSKTYKGPVGTSYKSNIKGKITANNDFNSAYQNKGLQYVTYDGDGNIENGEYKFKDQTINYYYSYPLTCNNESLNLEVESGNENIIEKGGNIQLKTPTTKVPYNLSYEKTITNYYGDATLEIKMQARNVDSNTLDSSLKDGNIENGEYSNNEITWKKTYKNNGSGTVNITFNVKTEIGYNWEDMSSVSTNISAKIYPRDTDTDGVLCGDSKNITINLVGKLTVNHYLYGTKIKVADQESLVDVVGNSYSANKTSTFYKKYTDIGRLTNVESATEGNPNGNYQQGETIVNYYYKLEQPCINNSLKIDKEEAIISSENTEVTYNITYEPHYYGKAISKIEMSLPFKIDEESDLDGGTYDEANNKIVWNLTENDNYETENYGINFNKTITINFLGVYEYVKEHGEESILESTIKATTTLDVSSSKCQESIDYSVEVDKKLPAKVIVNHYNMNTNKKEKEEIIKGYTGETYKTTELKELIEKGYNVVKIEGEKEGVITEEEIIVNYYYRLIENPATGDNIMLLIPALILSMTISIVSLYILTKKRI